MKRYLSALVILAASSGVTGCIVKDTTHRLYLSPSGAVVWTVLEQEVRSDEAEPWKRQREELEFLGAIARDMHPMSAGLRHLNPDGMQTRVLRADRPYSVLTEARFARIDHVIEQLFGELRVPVRATLEPQNRGATLTVVVNLDDRSEREPEPETPVAALVEDLHRYRIVLTEGRFVSSSGVDIVDDGAAAKLSVSEETLEAGGVLRFELRWQTAR